ncbi:MAG: plasmid stabilization system protein [Phycisphaerales bacterium]|nr:plasmid stabilization system protein [Phycisphaerales bacterium]
MKPRIVVRPEVQRDLDEQVVYIGERNFDAAERYEKAVLADFRKLAEMPGMGALRNFPNPRLQNVRSWPVSGFGNYLIFYIPTKDGIDVLRVLHGARNLDQIFRH